MIPPRWRAVLAELGLAGVVIACTGRELGQASCLPPSSKPATGRLALLRVAPDTISTEGDETDAVLAPDGSEILFTARAPWTAPGAPRVILRARCVAGHWAPPEIALDQGMRSAMSPAFSPDGDRLYFAMRDSADGGASGYDLWYAVRAPEGGRQWKIQARLPVGINSDANELAPSVTRTGEFYFISDRSEAPGGSALFRAGSTETPGPPTLIGYPGAVDAAITPDGSRLFLAAVGRNDANRAPGIPYQRGDLYFADRDATGNWGSLQPLPMPVINSVASESAPRPLPDGRLMFSSERGAAMFGHPPTRDREGLMKFLQRAGNGQGDIYITIGPVESKGSPPE